MTHTASPYCTLVFAFAVLAASNVRAEGPAQGTVYVTPPAVAPVVVTPPAVAPASVNAQATVTVPRPSLSDLDVTMAPGWRPVIAASLGGGARVGDGATATGSFSLSAGIDYGFIVEPRVSYVANFDQVGENPAAAAASGDESRWSATHALMGGVRLKLDRVGPSLHLDLDAGYSFNAGPFGADLPDGAVARAGLGWRWYVNCENSDEAIELGVDALFGLMDNRANDAVVARVGFNFSPGSANARSTWQCRESMRRRAEREAAEAEGAARVHANAQADLEGRAELIARLETQAPRPVAPPPAEVNVQVSAPPAQPTQALPPSPYGTPVYVTAPSVPPGPVAPPEPSTPSRGRFLFGASAVFGFGLSDDGLLDAGGGSAVGGGFSLGFTTNPWYEVRAEYLAYNRNDKPHDAGVHTTSVVGRLNLTEVAPFYVDAGLGWAFVNANPEVGESDNGAVARVGLGYVARMGCSGGTDFGLTFGAEGHAGLMGNRAADAFLLRTGFELGAGSSAYPRCVEAQETSGVRLVLGGYTVGGVTPTASATHGAGAGAFGIGATFGIGLSSWIEARLNAEAGWRFDENTLSSFDPSLTARIGLDKVAPVYVEAGLGYSTNAEQDGPFARFGVGYRRFTGCGNGFEGVLTAGIEGRMGLVDNRVSDAVLATLGIDLNIGSGVTSGGSWQCYESPAEYAERMREEAQERAEADARARAQAEERARARADAEARARVAASAPRVGTRVEIVPPSVPRTQVEVIAPRAPRADFRADVRSDIDAAVEVEVAAEPTVAWDLSINLLGGLALSADGEVPGALGVLGGGFGAGIRVAPWFEPRVEFDVVSRVGMPKDTSSGVVTPSLVTRFDLGTVAPIYIDAGVGYGIAYAGGITTPDSGLVARFGVGYRRYAMCGTNDSSFRIGLEGRAGLMENRNADMVLVSAAFDFGFGKVRSAETAQCRAAARASAYGTVEVRSPSPEEMRRTQEALDTAARGAATVRSVMEGGGRVDVRVDVRTPPPPPPSR